MNPRNFYVWAEQSKPGLIGWLVVICVMAGVSSGAVERFAFPGDTTQIVLCAIGVALAVGVSLGHIRFEITLANGDLTFRRRPLFGFLLGAPWTERRIPRQSIRAFRLDRNPWNEQKSLTILVDDGSSLAIPAPPVSGKSDAFESFVAGFRAFLGADAGRKAQESRNVWRIPIHQTVAGGIVVVLGVTAALAVRDVMDNKSAMIAVIAGAMVVVAGLRFMLRDG